MKKFALALAACILALLPAAHGRHHDGSDTGASSQRIDWD